VGHGTEGQPGYVAPAVADVSRPGGAGHRWASMSGPKPTYRTTPCGKRWSEPAATCSTRPLLGYHAALGEGLPEGDPRVGGYSALRRSGAMSLLAPYRVRRAGAI